MSIITGPMTSFEKEGIRKTFIYHLPVDARADFEKLLDTNPGAFNEFLAEFRKGAHQERERIQGIHELMEGFPQHKKLIMNAMWNPRDTKETVAADLIKIEKSRLKLGLVK